jgi:hypothetical protein
VLDAVGSVVLAVAIPIVRTGDSGSLPKGLPKHRPVYATSSYGHSARHSAPSSSSYRLPSRRRELSKCRSLSRRQPHERPKCRPRISGHAFTGL